MAVFYIKTELHKDTAYVKLILRMFIKFYNWLSWTGIKKWSVEVPNSLTPNKFWKETFQLLVKHSFKIFCRTFDLPTLAPVTITVFPLRQTWLSHQPVVSLAYTFKAMRPIHAARNISFTMQFNNFKNCDLLTLENQLIDFYVFCWTHAYIFLKWTTYLYAIIYRAIQQKRFSTSFSPMQIEVLIIFIDTFFQTIKSNLLKQVSTW